LSQAMAMVREPAHRRELTARGRERAARYSWKNLACELHDLIQKAGAERESLERSGFFREWRRLRAMQAEVDPG
jgi:hypothetical protein